MTSCVALDAVADQISADSHTDRILRWIRTGKHTFETDYVESKVTRSISGTEKIQDTAVGKAASALPECLVEACSDRSSCDESDVDLTPQPEPIELLVGCDVDLLIPSTEQINGTLVKGQNLWCTYIAGADLLRPGCVPAATLEACNFRQDIPPLPQDLCKKQIITGQALWHVPSPEFNETPGSSRHDDIESPLKYDTHTPSHP